MTRRNRLAPLVLLVLPLLGSDCSDDNSLTAPPVTGTVQGTVTVDGEGLAGVTVTTSTGATAITNADGQYAIPDVPEGVHTVTISGFPGNVTFPVTGMVITITSEGQALPVDFSGSRVGSSAVGFET